MRSSRNTDFLLAAFIAICSCSVAGVAAEPSLTVSLGTPFSEAKRQLEAASIKETGQLQIMPRNEDTLLAFYLLESDCDLVVSHSKTSKRVTGLSLYYVSPERASRTDKVYRGARSITFLKDKSYTVHFQPPASK